MPAAAAWRARSGSSAGSIGYRRPGERVLFKEARAAPAGTLLLADGFSCREQIAQATGRRALHLAEVLLLAQRGGVPDGNGRLAHLAPPDLQRPSRRLARGAAVGAAALAAGALAWGWARRER